MIRSLTRVSKPHHGSNSPLYTPRSLDLAGDQPAWPRTQSRMHRLLPSGDASTPFLESQSGPLRCRGSHLTALCSRALKLASFHALLRRLRLLVPAMCADGASTPSKKSQRCMPTLWSAAAPGCSPRAADRVCGTVSIFIENVEIFYHDFKWQNHGKHRVPMFSKLYHVSIIPFIFPTAVESVGRHRVVQNSKTQGFNTTYSEELMFPGLFVRALLTPGGASLI